MSSRKRSRDPDDLDGEVEVESASSSLRQGGGPKRSKVALARENGGSVISDDDEENSDDAGRASRASRGISEFVQDEDGEIDDLRATQIVEKQFRGLRENMASEQGIIEEVYCRNFMCHSKLRIKLGPLINFIIGHNGSGKSAVLTALTMCLGGKATATNRGASLKNLIKEGEDNATLAVKIKNQGEGAYKPELYGESITVERHFSRNGASGFKLKNDQDKPISSKKADLDDILDFFAFQLDNPINVLTQDMARQFLSNSTSSDKYKFFIRGTCLEVLDADYKLLEESLDGISHKLYAREQDMSILKSKFEEAERKKQRVEQINTIKQKIKDLQRMHAWAQVEEQERDLEKCEASVSEAADRVQEKRNAAEDVDGVYEGHNQSWEGAKRSLSDFQTQLEPVTENHKLEKDAFDTNKGELLKLKTEERTMKENITKAKSDVRKYEKAVNEEKQRLADAEGPEHAARLDQLETLKHAAEEAKLAQMEHGTGIAELERKRAESERQHDEARPQQKQREDELKRLQTRLNKAKAEQQSPFDGYRPNMENLVRQINRETRWRSKPVGPVGHHVKLLKQEWSSHIERTFGGVLESFVVTNKEDADLLSQIMSRVKCTPGTLICTPGRLDTTGKEPRAGVDTILRVLEIDNDDVRNQLIINQAIEQTVLIQDRKEAYDFAYAGPRPQNVKSVICWDDNDKRAGWRFDWSRTGAAKSSPVARWDVPRMQSNRSEQIASAQQDVEQAGRDVTAIQAQVKQLQNAAVKAKQDVVAFQRRQKDLLVASQRAEDAVVAKQEEIDASRPQHGKLQELEHQLSDAKGEHEAGQASYIDMVNAMDRLNEIAKEIKTRLDAAQAELDQANKRVVSAEKRVHQTELARQNALREKNLAHQHIADAQEEQDGAEKRRDTQRNQVELFIGEASKIAERMPVERGLTATAIDQRLDKLVKDKDRAMKEMGGSEEELNTAYLVARKEYEDGMKTLKDMSKVADVSCPATHFCLQGRKLTYWTDAPTIAGVPLPPLGPLPLLDLVSCAHQLRLPPQRAPIPRSRAHRSRQQAPRNPRRARPLQNLRRRPRNQNPQRRRKVLLHHLPLAFDLGGHGLANPLPR